MLGKGWVGVRASVLRPVGIKALNASGVLPAEDLENVVVRVLVSYVSFPRGVAQVDQLFFGGENLQQLVLDPGTVKVNELRQPVAIDGADGAGELDGWIQARFQSFARLGGIYEAPPRPLLFSSVRLEVPPNPQHVGHNRVHGDAADSVNREEEGGGGRATQLRLIFFVLGRRLGIPG